MLSIADFRGRNSRINALCCQTVRRRDYWWPAVLEGVVFSPLRQWLRSELQDLGAGGVSRGMTWRVALACAVATAGTSAAVGGQ